MRLPFSEFEFFAVMAAYNQAVWPAQLALEFGAFAVIWLALRRTPNAGVWTSAILAVLWSWTGIAYHWAFFTGINRAAWAFGALCVAAASAFAWFGIVRRRIVLSPRSGGRALLGWTLVCFAIVFYPALSVATGHRYPELPTFGLPCPTTIFTVGVLLLATRETPRWVFVSPAIWSAIGGSAAVLLGVYADLALLLSATVSAWGIVSATKGAGKQLHPAH